MVFLYKENRATTLPRRKDMDQGVGADVVAVRAGGKTVGVGVTALGLIMITSTVPGRMDSTVRVFPAMDTTGDNW
jgi:hypothetical protein